MFELTFNCPYCGHKNIYCTDSHIGGSMLYTCNEDEGGCGGQFVLRWGKPQITEITVHKIEGEE